MQKILAVAFLPLILAACGGGSDSAASTESATTTGSTASGSTSATTPAASTNATGTTASSASSANPLTANYLGYNFRQDLTVGSYYFATFIDKGIGVAGSLTYGRTPNTYPMTPNKDGSIAYSVPVTASVAIGSNTVDTNLPAIAMLCQNIAGTGTSGNKSTDILVTNEAHVINSAAELAGQALSVYREDCYVGGTNPPTNNETISFDASGNMTVKVGSQSRTFSADQVTSALNGQPIYDASAGSYTVFYAFSYIKQDGTKAYGMIEHDGSGTAALTNGVLGLWTQQ